MNRINVVFIGESGVGKTSIMNRLLKRPFTEEMSSTIGLDNDVDKITDVKSLPNTVIQINYCDTPGQDKFHSVCAQPIRTADILIFVIDNENDGLLENENWMGWIKFVEDIVNIQLPEKKFNFLLK